MNRRSFFKRMFCGVAAVVGLPLVINNGQLDEETIISIRDKLKNNEDREVICITGTNGYDGLYSQSDFDEELFEKIESSSGPTFFYCTDELEEKLKKATRISL